jgi:outer membrane protein OmpA-like peptidoglycan-associated protein
MKRTQTAQPSARAEAPSNKLQRRHLLVGAVGLALGIAAPHAAAQAVKVYGATGAPSAEEIADILANGARKSMRQRGVRLGNGELPSPAAPEPQRATDNVAEASAFSMPISFDFDSAELEPAALMMLNLVAEGIKLNNGAFKVLIEGHTDAHGRLSYNERLSLRRAESVRRYLTEQRGLSADLLLVQGLGPRRPIQPEKPFAAENRRVQFRAG